MNVRILVIEDNDQDQKIMKRYLTKEGYGEILFADSGEKGVELFKKSRPPVVITDTNLPGMNGFETCRQIKAVPEVAVKVIVMTGFIDAVDAIKAKQMGADDYCVKTADCAPLLESLRSVMKP